MCSNRSESSRVCAAGINTAGMGATGPNCCSPTAFLLYIADHTHDLTAVSIAEAQMPANGIIVAQIHLHESFTDDDHLRRTRFVGIGKRAALQQRNAENVKEIRREVKEIGDLPTRIHVRAVETQDSRIERSLVRQTDRDSRGFDAGQFANARQTLVEEAGHLAGSGVARILQRELGGGHVLGIESRMKTAQVRKCADEQSRADQKDHAESHLAGNEQAPGPGIAAARSAATSLGEDAANIEAAGRQGGIQAEQNAC